MTGKLFQLTNSITFTLVPGDDSYLDKKEFTWELVLFESNKIGFKITFKHPEYISVGKPDTMKIVFTNADKFLKA